MSRLRDSGAPAERTTLAWSRTTLSLIAAGLLCVRLAPSTTGAILAAATVCGAVSLQLRRTLKRHPRLAPHHLADPVSVLLATAVTLLFAALGLLFTLGA
jgi:uncharacterized membrane protein YidH (DUF202 family)